MNNKKNRKGFTIVELSIVIAVIAILAAVMIPTFTNIISKSNDAADRQNAKTVYSNYVDACILAEQDYKTNGWVKVDENRYVEIKNGAAEETIKKDAPAVVAGTLLICAECGKAMEVKPASGEGESATPASWVCNPAH